MPRPRPTTTPAELGTTPETFTRVEDGVTLPFRVWRFREPRLALSSAPVGGGIGLRPWIVNAQVRSGYARTDLDAHVAALARLAGLDDGGRTVAGVGLLTAADVDALETAIDDGVRVDATVGVHVPIWAASADHEPADARPGTINIVAQLPVRLDDAALVNAVATMTEAKTQALLDCGVNGTGTATDAVCLVCPADPGTNVEPAANRTDASLRFGGPRSPWGAALARAVHRAVLAGARGSLARIAVELDKRADERADERTDHWRDRSAREQ